MQFAKPVFVLGSLAAILATIVVVADTSNAQSNPTRQRSDQQQQQQQSSRTVLEYATLTNQRVEQSGRTTYQAVWDFGDFTLDGESTQSIEDAYRKLSGKFGGGISSVSNLSTMLTRIGTQGWELIETSGEGSTTTRIFMRRVF